MFYCFVNTYKFTTVGRCQVEKLFVKTQLLGIEELLEPAVGLYESSVLTTSNRSCQVVLFFAHYSCCNSAVVLAGLQCHPVNSRHAQVWRSLAYWQPLCLFKGHVELFITHCSYLLVTVTGCFLHAEL